MINLISLLLFFIVYPNIYETGDRLLKNLQDKFEKIEDLSAEFKQSTNGKATIAGKFIFKREDMLRIELKNSILISNGSTNWNYNQKENRVIISNSEENNASPLSLKKIVYDYPKECTVTSETNNGEEVLVFTPNKNSSIGYIVVKMWISKENLISRILMKDKADNLIQIDFSKYKLNQRISDSKFNFTPAEGSKVIDLR